MLKFIVDGKEIKEEDLRKISNDEKKLEDVANEIDHAANVEILIQD
jgi:hypothetical protein